MDTDTLLSSLLDCDASMAGGSSIEGSMHYRDSVDTDLAPINAFLNDYSPVEALNGLDDTRGLLTAKDEGFMSSPPSVDCKVQDSSNSDSDRVDAEVLKPGRGRKRVKTHHPSRKAEVSSLRAEAESLQAKLLSLQYRSARALSTETVSSQAQQVWRRVALSQLDRRRRAEAENALLREMAAVQILEAKNLRRILKRRTRIEMMEQMLGVKGMTKLLENTPHSEFSIFQELNQDADALYRRTDSLFSIKDMDALPCTGQSREVNLNKFNGVYYEVRQKRLVPFNLQETDKAVWQYLGCLGLTNMRDVGGPEVRFNAHADPLEAQEDTLQTTFSVAISGFGDLIGTCNRKVVRRYKDGERVVLICRILSEPRFQSGHSGVSATTTAHFVLEESDQGGLDATVMKIYFSAERDISPSTEDVTAPLAISAWGELVPRIPGDVEAILLTNSSASSFSSLVAA